MTYAAERRRFKRIRVSLPLKYHGSRADTGAPFQGQGVLRDISLSGIYFHVDPATSLRQGQTLSLAIFPPPSYRQDIGISHLQATGEVVRFEPPGPQCCRASVALNFLDSPKLD